MESDACCGKCMLQQADSQGIHNVMHVVDVCGYRGQCKWLKPDNCHLSNL